MPPSQMPRLRILTWHVHGSYLDSLIHTGHEFFLPVRGEGEATQGGIGKWGWPSERVHEVPERDVADLDIDLVVYQTDENWYHDGPRILSDRQRRGPRIYIEHDPPWDDPTEAHHPIDDPGVLLVHVTAFNALMWNSGRTPTRVIDHGVPEPDVRWTGTLERGLVVVNDMATRGRRLGRDIFERARDVLPIDLVGMRSEEIGGLGEVPRSELPAFAARYRFFFHPVRYTSLGMAACEAMMIGMPVIALATTEMPTVIENRRSGIIDTDPDRLIDGAAELLRDHAFAARLGEAGRAIARERFSLARFTGAWNRTFHEVVGGIATGRDQGLDAVREAVTV